MRTWVNGALYVALLSSIAGCGGSTSSPSPVTPPAKITNQANASLASAGTLALAMAEFHAARYYARYLRPGVGLSLGSNLVVQPTPACNASTQTASKTTVDTLQNYSVLTAYYPAGDSTCSRSPVAVAYMYYPKAALPQNGTPQVGYGYVAHFADANDPIYPTVGAFIGADSVWTAVYTMSDGTANVASEVIPAANVYYAPNPSPGLFPATFPNSALLTTPQRGALSWPYGTYFATVESSATGSTTGVAVSTYASFGVQQERGIGISTGLNVTISPSAGTSGFTATEANAAYNLDTSPFKILNGSVPANAYQLGAGNTVWPLSQPSIEGVIANNFGPGQDSFSATYAANGSMRSLHLVNVDSVNGIRAQIDLTAPNTFTMVLTDTIANASAITPSQILIDGDGYSQPFKYVLDGTSGRVRAFTVVGQ